jgi:hypothetical protein
MFVRKTNNKELEENWKLNPNLLGDLFVETDSEGNVDWENCNVYSLAELLEKSKIQLLTI